MNLDKYSLILSGGDGGDTCHRMYTLFLRMALLERVAPKDPIITKIHSYPIHPITTQQLLEPNQDGIYIRHCDPNFWGSDPRNHSRDQITPVICYHAYVGNKAAQTRLLKQCIKRKMFAQNIYPNWVDPRIEPVKSKTPDFLTFELWGIFARTYIYSIWFPLALLIILFGDLALIFSAMLKVWAPITQDGTLKFRWPKPNDVDDDNINNVLMVTQYLFPTPLSYLARKIYKTFRRTNLGNTALGELSPIMGALVYYHRDTPDAQGNPEIAEAARRIVGRY
jgi:hypothetical protein